MTYLVIGKWETFFDSSNCSDFSALFSWCRIHSWSLYSTVGTQLICFFFSQLAGLRREFESVCEQLELIQGEMKSAHEQLAEMKLTSEENNTLRVHLQEEEVNK